VARGWVEKKKTSAHSSFNITEERLPTSRKRKRGGARGLRELGKSGRKRHLQEKRPGAKGNVLLMMGSTEVKKLE